MNNATRPVADEGVAVRYPCKLSNGSESDDFYILTLKYPQFSDDDITYETVTHLFTSKELNRVTVRYYSDCNLLDDEPLDSHMNIASAMGYVSTRTYVNKNEILTTRFVVKFNGAAVKNVENKICIGLFTARELKRSRERVNWVIGNKPGWLTRIFGCLTGRR